MIGEQLGLALDVDVPDGPDSVRLICGDVREAIALVEEPVGIVHADCPWSYSTTIARGTDGDDLAELPYATDSDLEGFARVIDEAFDVAVADCYLLSWCTFPQLRAWFLAEHAFGMRWEYLTGGAWVKYSPTSAGLELGAPGIGHHWRGDSELLLVYRKGRPAPLATIRNAYALEVELDEAGLAYLEQRGRNSEKPVKWLEQLLGAFCGPGLDVLDLYSGLAPLARATLSTGHGYVGAEIDVERHRAALALLAQHRVA